MEENKVISKKELARRKKLSERRRKGYERYIKRKRKEKEIEEQKKIKKKEKERLRKEKEKILAKSKKKIGRPKKRGPKINYYKRKKKKNIKTEPKIWSLPPFKYKIISCRNGVQNKFIGKYRDIEDAYEVFEELKENDKNIIFQSMITGCDTLENSMDEYLLIENKDVENSFLRNEYGKLVEQKTNLDGWVIVDKYRYKREETFWVYGFDKSKDRKTILWIYNNLLLGTINSPYEFKRVLTFRNKVIFKDDNEDIIIIFCKHPFDAIRFYNMLELWVKKDKIKQILFIGDYSEKSEQRRKIEDKIMEVTGWSRKKVNMNGTSYFLKNEK